MDLESIEDHMTIRSFSDLIANEDTNLTATAVGDYLLIYDASEPLDINKIKVVSIADLMKLTTETARQPMVTGQAAGDLFYASAAGVLARLAKGTAGQGLKMNGDATAPEWVSTGIGCSVYHSTTQAIPTATYTPVLFDSEYFDDADFHSTLSNPERITIPIGYGGTYLFGGSFTFNNANYSVRVLRIRLNGTTLIVGATNTVDGGNDKTSLSASSVLKLNEGDYLELLAYHTVGSNVNLITDVPSTLWCVKL